jgi:hypothetical protein
MQLLDLPVTTNVRRFPSAGVECLGRLFQKLLLPGVNLVGCTS